MATPRRILIIRPSALGDVARTVPLLASLRAALPDARIDWLVQEGFEPVIRHHPALDEAVLFPRRALGEALRRGRATEVLRFGLALRRRAYDTVVDAQGLLRSGLLGLLSGAPVRIGLASAREGGSLFYTRTVHSRSEHTVDRMLDLLAPLGAPARRDTRLYADPALLDRDARAPVVVAPTSRWPAKRWPIERFAELTRRLLADGVPRVVVVGGPGERDQCGPLLRLAVSDPRVEDRVGATGVADLCALIAHAGLVVANDSAAAHIAVGFSRPLVAIYGPTDARRVGPYRRDADVVQRLLPGDRFDHKHDTAVRMVERVPVEAVHRACLGHLLSPAAVS